MLCFLGRPISPEDQSQPQSLRELGRGYPQDVNSLQSFPVADAADAHAAIDRLRIELRDSTDFYGRVVVYQLQIEIE